LALLGIVVVNVAAYRRGVGPTLAAGGGRVGGEVDGLTVTLSALAEGRFYPLFSFLFGWGFAVQDSRSREAGRSVVGPWLRRLGLLWVLGLAHALLAFDGDILSTYAVIGVGLLLVRPLRPGWLAALGVSLLAVQALFTAGLEALIAAVAADGGADVGAQGDYLVRLGEVAAVYGDGSFGAVLAERAFDFGPSYPLGFLTVGGTVAGMMVLGLAAGRAGWLEPARWPRWLRSGIGPLWLVGLVASIPAARLLGETSLGTDAAGEAVASRLLYALLGPAMALAWAGVILRLAHLPALRRFAGLLAPAGRMSLTVYLSQSVIGSVLFNGYGFDLGDRLGIGGAVAVMVGVWVAQVVLAALWLRAFSVGPLEAVARAAAYLHWPGMRRRPAPTPLATSEGPG